MAITEHYYTKFEESYNYHIYNRSVDRKPMFKKDENYLYFMRQYNKYLSPVVDTYSYCLLGNHFYCLSVYMTSCQILIRKKLCTILSVISPQIF